MLMKQMLSEPCKRLVEMMQKANFGRVIFMVRAGAPDFTQKISIVRTIKLLAGDNDPRPEAAGATFELRREVISLRDQVANAPDGACVTVQVKYGLPFLTEIQEEQHA